MISCECARQQDSGNHRLRAVSLWIRQAKEHSQVIMYVWDQQINCGFGFFATAIEISREEDGAEKADLAQQASQRRFRST